MQSQQNMVFLTTDDKRKIDSIELAKEQVILEELSKEIVEGFVNFSRRWGGQ